MLYLNRTSRKSCTKLLAPHFCKKYLNKGLLSKIFFVYYKYEKGKSKIYMGVPGNLVAFACKLSFQRGHEGNVSFISKSQLIQHYIDTLGAMHVGGRILVIDTIASLKLIDKYFPK